MKILIADDDPISQKQLEKLLTTWGHEYLAVTDGDSALEEMEKKNHPEMAILDWMMPGKSGLDICTELRKLNPPAPPYIIMLTSKTKKDDIVIGLDQGANDYVTKPYDIKELNARINIGLRILELQKELKLHRNHLEKLVTQRTGELMESEAKYRNIFESFTDVYFRTDAKRHITEISPSVKQYGYNPDDLIGREAYTLYYETSKRKSLKKILNKDGSVEDYEMPLKNNDGTLINVSANIHVVKDKNGKSVGLEGTLRDITTRINAEKEIELHRDHLEEMVELRTGEQVESLRHLTDAEHMAKLGHWKLDLTTNELTWSAEIYRIFDLDPKDFDATYDAFLDAIHPEDRDLVDNAYKTSLETKKPFDIQHRLLMKDGTIKYVNEKSKTEFDKNDKPIRTMGTVQDITDQVLTEIELNKSREQFELALQSSGAGLWDWNIKTGDVFFNERWTGMLGYGKDELEPNIDTWVKIVHPNDMPRVEEVLNEHLQGITDLYQTEHRCKTKSGKWKWILDTGKVVEWDEDNNPLRAIGTHIDITEQKLAEKELKKERDGLQVYYEAALNQEKEIMRLQDIITGLGGSYE